MKKYLLASFVALGIATTAQAHLLFPAQTADGYTLKLWADDRWEVPKPENVIGVHVYQDGKLGKVGYDYKKGTITLAKDSHPDMLTSEYDFGYYTFTADKHFAKARDEVDGTIYDTRIIYKLGKGLYQWNDVYSKPVGMKFEVTPLSNPLALKVGDKLKVLVTLNGQPYAGAGFEDQMDDLDDVTTDANGIAEITLRKPQDGLIIIGASAKLPYQLADKHAETLQYTGVLAFKPAQ